MTVKTESIDSICELVVDCPHSTPKWTDSGVIVLRNKNIKKGVLNLSSPSHTNEEGYQKRIKRAAPKAGDIVFTREVPMGEVCMIPEGIKCCLGQRQVLLRPKKEINNKCLFWALQSPYVLHQISWSEGTGTTVSNVRIPVLKELQIPRLCGQEDKIAEILSSLDNKIILNQQINQTLEQMAQALFKSWFVDFDPVKAKIAVRETGGTAEQANLSAMQVISGKTEAQLEAIKTQQPERYKELKTTAELFPDAMQDSEFGDVPVGWIFIKISEFGTVICGKTPSKKKPEFYKNDIPFIKIPDMHGNMFSIKTNEYLSYEGAKNQIKKQVPAGSICVSCIATVGQVVITTQESHTNQQINTIIPFKDIYMPFLYFKMNGLTKDLHDLASGGSATLNLNTGNFSKIQILKPDEKILIKFYDSTKPWLEMILLNAKENQSLTQLRDTLLPKLLSGEMEVSL